MSIAIWMPDAQMRLEVSLLVCVSVNSPRASWTESCQAKSWHDVLNMTVKTDDVTSATRGKDHSYLF